MAVEHVPAEIRDGDFYHHIDMGFLNRRLAFTAVGPDGAEIYRQNAATEDGHMARLGNDHLLVTILIDRCEIDEAPTLIEALESRSTKGVFRSTERLAPCPDIGTLDRVEQRILLDVDFEKPVFLVYHTSHIVADTGKLALRKGFEGGCVESIIGSLHDRGDRWEVEPIVMGAPWFEHPRNGKASDSLMWLGRDFGELLAEDIDQFANLQSATVSDADEWMDVMRAMPEAEVKGRLASLLGEPVKADWGGETNDLYSAHVQVGGRRRTAAFLLKGPTNFREMTLDMCGKRADQVLRLTKSGADISIVQHSHQIGEAVRETLRALVVKPGRPRKYCLIDGQTTYRILKANNLL